MKTGFLPPPLRLIKYFVSICDWTVILGGNPFFVFVVFVFLFFTFQAFPHSSPVLPPLPKRLALDKSSWTGALLNPGLLHYQQALANAQFQPASAAFYPAGEPSEPGLSSLLSRRFQTCFALLPLLAADLESTFLFLSHPGSVLCMTPTNSIGRSPESALYPARFRFSILNIAKFFTV